MESKSKISVVVVCYNQEETIARTLDSILEQRGCSRYEILVSDDCSKDNTAAIAREYEKRFPGIVKVHVNQKNQGVQANYFSALRRAEGEYIADCAGDDFWCDPDKLAKEETVLDNHPEVSMVHTGFDYVYPDGRKERAFPSSKLSGLKISNGKEIAENVLCSTGTPIVHLCTALYRKLPIISALDKNPDIFLNPQYKCEDLQIIVAAGHAGDIAYLPESTLCYSIGIPTISSTESFGKAFNFYFSTAGLRLILMRMHGIDSEKKKEALKLCSEYVMTQAFHEGSKENLHKIRSWMRTEGIPLSLKSFLFYYAGISPARRFLSSILLSRHKKHNVKG